MAKKAAARSKKVKLVDLPVKRSKGGQADKVKGGIDMVKVDTLGKVAPASPSTLSRLIK
jgi:hypothetical protein